ncbi:acetyl-CoA decarbonylase/synthase complex subunit delta [Candidatus Latescibacterota bacterium]
MSLPDVTEKWTNKILEVTLGTEPNQITIGGHSTLPYLHFEGETPNKTYVAMEIIDVVPEDWEPVVTEPFGDAINNPADWAKKCVDDFGAEMICLSLYGIHPDFGDLSVEHAVEVAKSVSDAVDVPLIIWGCGDDEKDNTVMPPIAEALKGKNVLLGSSSVENHKTLVAACQMGGHNMITESPLDINIAKQVNIMVSDSGFPLDRVVMYPTTGALGYGLEYAYSIMERGRLAALAGDKMMSSPVICRVGPEVCRVKEAKATIEEQPTWGSVDDREPMWEAMTASALLMAGADIMILRNPKAVVIIKKMVADLMKK